MGEVYDVHTHVGCDTGFYLRGWWPYAATAQDLIARMDAHGVDRAVCFPFTLPSAFDIPAFVRDGTITLLPGRFPFDRENELLAVELHRIGGRRLMQFVMFDPGREVAPQVDRVHGMQGWIWGLKTQTTILKSPIRALLTSGRDLMLVAEEYNLPALIHTAVHPQDEWAQVADCLAVAEAFPGVRFNLAHSLRFHREYLRRAAQMPNVWVDCSAHLIHCELARNDAPAVAPAQQRVDADYSKPAEVLVAIHDMLGGKYLWGSDNPFMSWVADKLASVYSYREEAAVLHALSESVRTSMATTAPRAWLSRGITS